VTDGISQARFQALETRQRIFETAHRAHETAVGASDVRFEIFEAALEARDVSFEVFEGSLAERNDDFDPRDEPEDLHRHTEEQIDDDSRRNLASKTDGPYETEER
jgi:hypothetical protein